MKYNEKKLNLSVLTSLKSQNFICQTSKPIFNLLPKNVLATPLELLIPNWWFSGPIEIYWNDANRCILHYWKVLILAGWVSWQENVLDGDMILIIWFTDCYVVVIIFISSHSQTVELFCLNATIQKVNSNCVGKRDTM